MAAKKKSAEVALTAEVAFTAEIAFTKAKLLKMEKYKDRADLLSVLLEDSKQYSVSEVDALIKEFMEGKVK